MDNTDEIKEFIKKKLTLKVLLSISGCSLPLLCIFALFFIVFLLVFNFFGLIDLSSGSSASNNGSGECGFTISETSLSKDEFRNALKEYSKTNSNLQKFADIADNIYDAAKSKNRNPELVIVRAFLETNWIYHSTNNYWGLGCGNGEACANGGVYSTLMEGVKAYLENISQYDSLKSMMLKYAYIGKYWYNPGSYDLGGCAYANYIYEEDMPLRVKNACSGSPCSGSEASCVPTTEEDQDAYATWQVKRMAEVRQQVFGLEQNDGPCTGGLTSLSNYTLSHEGLKLLNRKLTDSEFNELNNYIVSEVNKAGYGTGNGVAAAGQALTYWLEKKGFYLNYYYGGGHGDYSSYVTGAKRNWGAYRASELGHTANPYDGMDCSGFVSWAIRNGCTASYGSKVTSGMDHGKHIDVKNAKPGDIMLNPVSHVRLVVKNNGDGSVIVAEETSGANQEWGLIFTRQTTEAGYFYVDMSDYYKKNCETR